MSKEKFPLKVIKGGFAPADRFCQQRLKDKHYSLGDIVFAQITKPRNPKFNRKAHRLGELTEQNIKGFEGVAPHNVLKRLQLEGNIGCDEIYINFPGMGPCSYRVPRSLSFESMEEGEFSEVYKQFCEYIIKRYWPDMTEEQIESMADMVE